MSKRRTRATCHPQLPMSARGLCQRCYDQLRRGPNHVQNWRLPKPTTDERFWNKVNKTGSTPSHCPELSNCWVWTAGLQKQNGYPCFAITHSNNVRANRYVYELTYGAVPDNLMVLHKCDNRLCVNPSHLMLGSHQDNMSDKVSKGRQAKGSECGASKLTESNVIEIRTLFQNGVLQSELAKLYNVSQVQISNIVTRRQWKHVA